ncbi:recombinase family protein [Streptomyces sp. CB03911]|uniref:recombinase family protein n=1 Tax=Streptomyces sp. CB03911 TaxID=1804758 RepID=UPI00093DF7D2|nr:recombinase family protein [Streptomyces sp. CB03911]OKI19328.1 hypothetical protein A6A07_07485 [Streptomyces sp. CB03911]
MLEATAQREREEGQTAWHGPLWGLPRRDPQRLRAAIMTRLSRDVEDSTSIWTQEADGRLLCQLRGWDVVLVTYDVGVSGSIRPEDRPGFGVILGNLPNVDVVVARSVDRFTRQTSHFAGLVETLDAGATTLVDVQGQVDLTSPYGRFVTTIMVAFAQMEREMIQGRILRSRTQLRQAGRWLGGAAPYGFRIVPAGPSGKMLALDEYAAGQLRHVIRRLIGTDGRGVTLTSEVDRLNRDGILSPGDYRRALQGKTPPPAPGYTPWSYSPLYQHLRSEVLRGFRVVGKRDTRRVVRGADGAPVIVGPELVTADVWRALQAALDAAAVDPRRPRRKATLLLHTAWCPGCEEFMHYNGRVISPRAGEDDTPAPEGTEKRADLYNCPAARIGKRRPADGCPGVSIRAVNLEEMVEEWFLTRFGHFEYTERVNTGGSDHAADMADLEADIEELASGLAGLRGAAKEAVLQQLNARQDALEALQVLPTVPAGVRWVPTGRTVREEWEARDIAGRRLMLMAYRVRATVAPAYGSKVWNPNRVTIDIEREDPAADHLADIEEEETADY